MRDAMALKHRTNTGLFRLSTIFLVNVLSACADPIPSLTVLVAYLRARSIASVIKLLLSVRSEDTHRA